MTQENIYISLSEEAEKASKAAADAFLETIKAQVEPTLSPTMADHMRHEATMCVAFQMVAYAGPTVVSSEVTLAGLVRAFGFAIGGIVGAVDNGVARMLIFQELENAIVNSVGMMAPMHEPQGNC